MTGHNSRWLSGWPAGFAFAALISVAGPLGTGAVADERVAASAKQAGIMDLRQAGWKVVEQQKRIEKRPGMPPYEKLERHIQITSFVLEKNQQRKYCTLAYDSQRDAITQECRDAD